jgi:hypothetical protein
MGLYFSKRCPLWKKRAPAMLQRAFPSCFQFEQRKVKPKFFLVTEHHVVKTYGGMAVKIHAFLIHWHELEVSGQLQTPPAIILGQCVQ